MPDRPPRFSLEAKKQLAKLRLALETREITRSEYQIIADWLENYVYLQLNTSPFSKFGSCATRLYGTMTNPLVRTVSATHLPRMVRIVVTQDEATQEVMIADIVFMPPFGE